MHHIIFNQKHIHKKNLKKADIVRNAFKNAGVEYEVHITKYKGHASEIVREITSDGNENVIVACGGDGTLHEVLNGFSDFEKNSLALIPIGTGNDFATAAKVPLKTKDAIDVILNGSPRPIDFIQLDCGLRSLNAIGMGIDVEVLKRAYNGKNGKKSKYLNAFIKTLASYRGCGFTVKYDGKEEKHFGLIAAIGNGSQFGGGIRLFKGAKIDDGYMNLVIADYISKFATVGAFIKLMRGRPDKIKQVTLIETKAASFVFHGDEYTVQADGELYDNIPFDAHIESGKLKFYLP